MSTFQLLWKDRVVAKHFRSGVSLHSHTMHSEEALDLLPRHLGKLPMLSRVVPDQVDYQRAFWTPPLSPRQAYRLEEKQIQRQLQLPAMVSLTDHDNIRAGATLQAMDRYQSVPVSVEWTVPFGVTFFHIGVHNLSAANASAILTDIQSFTAEPNQEFIREKLSLLHSYPDVLLVLNHPLWDEKGIGSGNHARELMRLLSLIHPYVHALELNGLRSWSENSSIIRLGRETGKPVVSGGDRHGCEPNAILNLSWASTFSEFVEEVRSSRSHLVFMPQYRQPLNWRTMQTVIDVLRDYPSSFAGRRLCTERVFYRFPDGSVESIATIFHKRQIPTMLKMIRAAVHLAEVPRVRSLSNAMAVSMSRARRSATSNRRS